MRCSVQTVLYITLAVVAGTNAFAQRGFGGRGAAAPVSSTARGIGGTGYGLAAPPSSTAIGAGAPPRSYGLNRGAVGSFSGGGYYGSRNAGASRAGRTGQNGYGGDYRRVPYQYFLTPYYYPFLDYGAAPYGGEPEDLPGNPDAALMDPNASWERLRMGDQIQRLTSELNQLKYDSGTSRQAAAPPADPPASVTPITVVLRTGQKLQVQNYAVMDQTFWDFSRQPARKIPVSTIDLNASSQATAASGGEFPQIGSRQ